LEAAIADCRQQLQAAPGWHGGLPVALLDRCWLRLQVLPVAELLRRFPVDASPNAPELVRFRQLLERGIGMDDAEQSCWEEFGQEACHLALRRFWQAQQQPHYQWQLEDYLALLKRYQQSISLGPRLLPLLVLPRCNSGEQLQCHWI
jgi:hypothetical protein